MKKKKKNSIFVYIGQEKKDAVEECFNYFYANGFNTKIKYYS